MAFAIYLGANVDAETNRVLDVAPEMTRAALGLVDGFANGIIARQIVELARAGERNPDLLCEGALEKLRGALFGENEGTVQAPRLHRSPITAIGQFARSDAKSHLIGPRDFRGV